MGYKSYVFSTHWPSPLQVYKLSVNIYVHRTEILAFSCFVCIVDNDECLINNGGCNQGCVNTIGSFYCTCIHGYNLLDDQMTCINHSKLAIYFFSKLVSSVLIVLTFNREDF